MKTIIVNSFSETSTSSRKRRSTDKATANFEAEITTDDSTTDEEVSESIVDTITNAEDTYDSLDSESFSSIDIDETSATTDVFTTDSATTGPTDEPTFEPTTGVPNPTTSGPTTGPTPDPTNEPTDTSTTIDGTTSTEQYTTEQPSTTGPATDDTTTTGVEITTDFMTASTTGVEITTDFTTEVTTQDSSTTESGFKTLYVSGEIEINVAWDAELADSTSDTFKDAAYSVENDLEELLELADDVTDATATVTAFTENSSSRKRRQTGASTATVRFTAEITVYESKSIDEIETSISNAIDNANPDDFNSFDSYTVYKISDNHY